MKPNSMVGRASSTLNRLWAGTPVLKALTPDGGVPVPSPVFRPEVYLLWKLSRKG